MPSARGPSYGPVCPVSGCHTGPFGDVFVWYMSHLVHEYGSNGIYLDDTWPYGCANEAHGCGYVGPDGKRRVTYPLRARNETYRRIRAVLAAPSCPMKRSRTIKPLPEGSVLGTHIPKVVTPLASGVAKR